MSWAKNNNRRSGRRDRRVFRGIGYDCEGPIPQGGDPMKPATLLRHAASLAAMFAAATTFPSADPQCFAPWTAQTKFFKYPAKKGPFRIALANGYIANTWRIQMIQTAKAYAAQPDVAAKLKEFKVVST